MFEDPKMAFDQLTDILVDWCDHDFDGDGFAGADSTAVATQVLKCITYAFAAQPEALGLFNDLVVAERKRMVYERARGECEDGSN